MTHALRSRSLLAVALFLASQAWSQEPLREQVFARANQALAAANEAQANVLAPVSYAEASRYYRDAEIALERGRRLEG
ncbi:MAG TPA: hypothetical protein VLD39_04305, partial [Gammaproteobacteria bacterium]|nr:hypothetical protein [Gammaproteobacteria bacterium]